MSGTVRYATIRLRALNRADGFTHSELALPRAEVDHNEAEPEDAVGVHCERDVLRLVEVLGHIAHLREVSCLTLYSVYCVENALRERESAASVTLLFCN